MAAPPISSALAARKQALRTAMLALRAGCNPAAGAALTRHVLAECPMPRGVAVAGFWPMGEEIDVRPLLHALHERGHPVLLPVTGKRGNPLIFRHWSPGMTLIREAFGTSRPTGETGVPDVLLVPLLAFDRQGRRLGYGGGFYDRTLAGLPGARAIGCAYAIQERDEVPADDRDARLHAVATENGMIICEGQPG